MEEYIINICKNKIDNKEIRSWDELALSNGYKSGEALRQAYKKYRAKNGELPSVKVNIDLDSIEIRKERIRMRDERNEFNRILKEQAKRENTQDIIRETVSELNKLSPLKIDKDFSSDSDSEAILMCGDWHVGELVELVNNKYDTDIFNERISKLINLTIKKCKLNNSKILNLTFLGDLLSGFIHFSGRLQNQEDLISQTKIVGEVISKMIYELSKEFDKVNISFVVGNHSRLMSDKKQSLKSENMENLIFWYVESRIENIRNAKIIKNRHDDIIELDIMGYKIAGIHGEGTSIDKVTNDLSGVLRYVPDVILLAHLHFPEFKYTGKTKIYRTGALIGSNNFSNSIFRETDASQTLIIVDKDGVDAVYNFDLA